LKYAVFAIVVLAGAGLSFAARIVVRSYLEERADFVRNPPTEISLHPERTGIPGLHEISIAAPDGSRLAAWYAPSSNRAAVVIVHGSASERSGVLPETRYLARAGFGALALDLPGQGASQGRTYWGVPERQAISAAVQWLAARDEVDPTRIGGFGQSMGAYVMTQAAVLDKRLRAVVLAGCPNDVVEQNDLATTRWGPLSQLPTYWALRASGMPLDMMPKDIIGAISPRPVFLIGGELDDLVPAFMARQLYQAAGQPKELWIVARAHHVDYPTSAPEEYPARLIDFYRRTLLSSP
jgi:dipeptidyl aminopeptidase/acylaminoacyl peptidase